MKNNWCFRGASLVLRVGTISPQPCSKKIMYEINMLCVPYCIFTLSHPVEAPHCLAKHFSKITHGRIVSYPSRGFVNFWTK